MTTPQQPPAWSAILIWQHHETQRFHPVFYMERPMPGPYNPDQGFVRLGSRGHHTEGVATLEETGPIIEKLQAQYGIPESHTYRTPVPWGGGLADILILPDWSKLGKTLTELLEKK